MTILVTHFLRRPRENVFSIERLYSQVRDALPDDICAEEWVCPHFSSGVWGRLKDIWLARRNQSEVNHVTGDVHYLTFLLNPRRTVLTVHDLVLLGRLKGISRFLIWLLWYWLPIKRSKIVVAISESTRAEILRSVKCNPEKIRVIHNCVSQDFGASDYIYNTKYPRILQVGTKPNKNLERVASALSGLSCRLVIIGPLSEEQTAALRRSKIDYENYVGLSGNELVAIYEAADMLLFASTYEGFGMPIIEAQTVGRPVITSKISSMPEISGPGACLVDPFDPDDIRAGVLKIMEDGELRRRLIASGFENAKRFSAECVAEQYAQIYRELAAGRRL